MNELLPRAAADGGCLGSDELTAGIVAAYVSNNAVPLTELGNLITTVRAAISGQGSSNTAPAEIADKPTPAQIKKSISSDALISFIDGKSYKTLKRHLRKNGLTFEQYKARYGLPMDYPSVAANYSEKRKELALSLGLGQKRRKRAA